MRIGGGIHSRFLMLVENVQDAVEKAMREDYRSDMGGASSMAHDAALTCGYHMSPNIMKVMRTLVTGLPRSICSLIQLIIP